MGVDVMRHQYPQFVEPAAGYRPMDVVRLKDGPIRVYRPGETGPLLTGHELILVSSSFAGELKRLAADSATFLETHVTRPSDGKQWSYVEVVPKVEISAADIEVVDASGYRLWHFGRSHLFVSPAIMDALQTHAWASELQFSPGFSRFAGAA